jgi:hypothetical protein
LILLRGDLWLSRNRPSIAKGDIDSHSVSVPRDGARQTF